MSENNKPAPKLDHKLVELEPIDMHGPILVTANAYLYLPDGRPAKLSFQMEPGQIPSRAKVKATLDALASPEALAESSVPPGTRLMTKPEFVAHVTKQETGQSMTMPGDQHFVPVPGDVPHAMLVHAVMGVWANGEFDMDLEDEYISRGLGELTRGLTRCFKWNKSALDALPDDVLIAIYERITQ